MSDSGAVDPRAVFVVHGRNLAARKAVFEFLRGISLHPLEWDEVALQTRSGSPFIFEILERGFEIAQAILIILTPDEEVTLRTTLRTELGDAKSRYQPRPNVLFEAGMAFMRDRRRTILLDFGSTDMLSDLHGVHALRVRSGAGAEMRKQLADRLHTAGCPVSMGGSDWMSAGNFDAAFLEEGSGQGTATSGMANPPHASGPSAGAANAREERAVNGGGDNRSVTARDITGSSIVTGDRNTVSTTMRQVPLPPAETVEARAELAALRDLIAQLKNVPERGKLDRALQDATDEISKADPDQEEVGEALGRAAKYARAADNFNEHAEKLAPRIAALASWLGAAGRNLLAAFGVGA
jgi:chaperonin cofactor prefoldin